MKNCEFCRIVAGRQPCYKVYEDENFLGFLDIFPGSVGHTLVIPKKHYQWVYDVPEFDKYWLVVLKITRAIQRALKPIFVTYLTYGVQVPHAHIHILPRTEENQSQIVPHQAPMNKEKIRQIAEKIYQQVKNG